MFNPLVHFQGIKTLTPEDLDLPMNSMSSGTDLDNIDDDINFSITEGNQKYCKIERELPKNNFNIRTLIQDKIEEMKRNSNIGWIPQL